MTPEEQLIQRYFDAFNRHDIEGVMACFHEHPVIVDVEGRRFEGREEVRRSYETSFALFPDGRCDLRPYTGNDGRGMAESLFHGTRPREGKVVDFFRPLRVLAASRLAELDHITRQFFAERGGLEPVDRKALLARVRKGLATVIDVRPIEEYRAGHIAGAISLPLHELQDRLAELPHDQDIIAYCRGPYCVLAAQAVELLREHGFQAVRLEDSVADWRAHGLPVATAKVS